MAVPLVSKDLFALVTVSTRPDEARGPPPPSSTRTGTTSTDGTDVTLCRLRVLPRRTSACHRREVAVDCDSSKSADRAPSRTTKTMPDGSVLRCHRPMRRRGGGSEAPVVSDRHQGPGPEPATARLTGRAAAADRGIEASFDRP